MNYAVIGGGASGLVAAIAAARHMTRKDSLVLFEKNDRVGKKILATGNGRCNLSNLNLSDQNYHGSTPSFVNEIFSVFGPRETLGFFQELGLLLRFEEGRVYPYTNQASSVLEVLRNELIRLNIETKCDTTITSISQERGSLVLNHKRAFDRIILATGSLAGLAEAKDKQGKKDSHDSNGYSLLTLLNHTVLPPYPALVQLKTEEPFIKALQGIRLDALVRFVCDGKEKEKAQGEVLFTPNGLSGPVILQHSRLASQHKKLQIILDLMPEEELKSLTSLLHKRRQRLSFLNAESFLVGALSKNLGMLLCKLAGIEKLSRSAGDISDRELSQLASLIKGLCFTVTGTYSFKEAQACGGGVLTGEFTTSLESKLVPGLYVTGELLDILGDCGGYNLQWAWSTGYIAGKNMVTSASRKRT